MEVEVLVDTPDEDINVESLIELIEFALGTQEVRDECEVSLAFVSETEIARLNQEYRSINSPTDVLSFEIDDAWDTPEGEIVMLGDVIIAPNIARKQTPTHNSTFEKELELLVVHGILHLLGYDHVNSDDEAEIMEAEERDILESWRAR